MSSKEKALQRHIKELLKECTPSLVIRMMAVEIGQNADASQNVELRQQLASDLVRFSDSIASTERGDNKQPTEKQRLRSTSSRIVSCSACDWRGSVRMAKTIEGASTLHCPRCERRLC